jgi:hypothetical protein
VSASGPDNYGISFLDNDFTHCTLGVEGTYQQSLIVPDSCGGDQLERMVAGLRIRKYRVASWMRQRFAQAVYAAISGAGSALF